MSTSAGGADAGAEDRRQPDERGAAARRVLPRGSRRVGTRCEQHEPRCRTRHRSTRLFRRVPGEGGPAVGLVR